MYSKRLNEFSVKYLEAQKESIKTHKLPALPVSKTRRMRDFVMDLAKYTNDIWMYADLHDHVMNDSERMQGGYLKPSGSYWQDGYVVSSENIDHYTAMMDSFDKYLCTDGVIRYTPTREGKVMYETIVQRREAEFWESINRSFEAMGMFYSDEHGCWVNPETGEEGYY